MSYRRYVTLFILLVTPLLLQSSAAAAKGNGRHTSALESLEYCLKQLDLTADQKPKVDDIVADAQKQAEAIRSAAKTAAKSGATTRPDVKQQAREITQQIHTRLESVLTPDQMAKLRKLLADERALRKEDTRDRRRQAATAPAAP